MYLITRINARSVFKAFDLQISKTMQNDSDIAPSLVPRPKPVQRLLICYWSLQSTWLFLILTARR